MKSRIKGLNKVKAHYAQEMLLFLFFQQSTFIVSKKLLIDQLPEASFPSVAFWQLIKLL
jgi:hypothetical protein